MSRYYATEEDCKKYSQDLQDLYATIQTKTNELTALQQTVAKATPAGSQYVPVSQFKNLERIEELQTEIAALTEEYNSLYSLYEQDCLQQLSDSMYKGGRKKQQKNKKTRKTRKAKGKRKH